MTPELAWAAGLALAIILIGVAINVFATAARSRLRTIALLYVFYLVALASSHLLGSLDEVAWARRLMIATEVVRVFIVVSLSATLMFRLILRGIAIPTIASDLLVGLGYIITTISVLSQHGLDPVGAVATGAAVSAILAFSLQSTLGNILGGVALQLDGSIHEGDWIQLENGKQGRVRAIRWRHTLLETRDWSTIVVPNASLLANNLTILGWRDGAAAPQRMWVYFNVDFRYAPNHVIQVVTDGLNGSPIENVAPDPPPNVICMDFARDGKDSIALYAARYWLVDLAADDPTSSRVRARIFTALKRAGIPLAVPAVTNLVQVNDRAHHESHVAREHDARFTALRAVQLFRPLTEPELRLLAEGVMPVIYTKGETITRQGAVAHYLYVLTKGSVEIKVHKPEDPGVESHVVAHLDAPEVFGEMGLMTGAPRGADVIATTDVECYRLDKATFERVILARPDAAKELADKLALRRANNTKLEKMNEAERKRHHDTESARILGSIKEFFGL